MDGQHSVLDGKYDFFKPYYEMVLGEEDDSSLCGNWGIVKYPHAEGVEAGSTLGTITGLSVTSVSDQKQTTFDFIAWVSGAEGAKVMAETGDFPALMTDDVANIIAGLDGFPTDAESKEVTEKIRGWQKMTSPKVSES